MPLLAHDSLAGTETGEGKVVGAAQENLQWITTGSTNINLEILKRCMRWLGHVFLMENNTIPKLIAVE